MNLKTFLKVVVALVLLVFAGSSFAQTTYYVNSVTGLDGYSGLNAAVGGGGIGPKLTISNAIAAAADGDIISIAGNASVPYNLEPTGAINISGANAKTLKFVVTAGTPVISADIVINPGAAKTVTFEGGFQIAAGKNFTITSGKVIGGSNLTFNATSSSQSTISRADGTTTFDTAPNMPNAASVNLVYGDGPADYAVGPEWTSATAINNVAINLTVKKLTLGGNRTLAGQLSTLAGGTLAIESNTLTLSAAAAKTHSNAGTITSTSVTSGEMVFTGDGAVTFNGAGDVPSIRKAGKGSVTLGATVNVNGSVIADAIASTGALTLTAATTVKGAITNNSVNSITLNGNAVMELGNGAGGPFGITNTSSGTITIAPAALRVVNIYGSVDNQGTGTIAFGNTAQYDIRGNLTLSGNGLVTVGTADTRVRGNVVNTGTMTLTANPATAKGNITFDDATTKHTVDGNVVNSKVVSLTINPTNGGASADNIANITFGLGAHAIGGSVTNRANLSGARGANNDAAGEGGLTNSGNININSTAQIVTIGGDVSNETVNSFDAAPGTNEGTGTFTNCGNITFANVGGALTVTGAVKNSSTGFTYTGADAMGSINAATLTAALTVGGIQNSSTNTSALNGQINFSAVTAAITVNGSISMTGATGTGDITLGAGATSITGDVTSAKAVTGANIVINADALLGSDAVTISGSLSNSGKSSIVFAATTGKVGAGALNLSDGVITYGNTTGVIGITNSLVVSGGTLTLGAAAATGNITVGNAIQFTAGTIDLGTGVRSIVVTGGTVEFKVGTVFANGASTKLLFNGSVAQTLNISSGGTVVYPGDLEVNNLIVPSTGAFTLANGNFRVGGTVTFTKGQVSIGNNYLFILKNFANNVTAAESYVTGAQGYISMQNGTATNVVTKSNTATFSNFEVDNANGCTIGLNNSVNETYTFTGAFNLTNGTVTGFTDIDDADVIAFNNATVPPTIYRNAGGFGAAPTFTSLVNVSYIGSEKTFSNEVPSAASGKLNNLTVATTSGTKTVTANVSFKVNGAVVVNDGQTLDLAATTMTMDSTAGAGVSTITLAGNADIVANGGKIVLNRVGGTTVTGAASTGNDASANYLPTVEVGATSKGNKISGVRYLVDAGAGSANLVVAAGGSLEASFTNTSSTTSPTLYNVEGNFQVDGQLTMNSPVIVAGNYDVDGKIVMGANDLVVLGNTLVQDGAATVTSTGGFLRVKGTGATSFEALTSAATVPYLEVALDLPASVLTVKTQRLQVSNTLQHTKGQLLLNSDLRVTGNTYNVTKINEASIDPASAGALQLQAAADVLTWTLNDPAAGGAAYEIGKLTISNPVTLAGSATGGLKVKTALTHSAGELNFGARNITIDGTATFTRTGGTYAATTGYLVYNSTGAFKEGTGFSIPNFRVSAALNPADDKAMVVTNNIELGATFTQAAGAPAASLLSLGVSGGSVPTIIVKGGNFDQAPVFAQGQANYSFGANATVDDAAKYWPSTAVANDVTIDGAATTVDFAKDRTISGNLNLTKGAMTITDVTVTLASGATITRSELGSLTLLDGADAGTVKGVLSAANVNLTYSKNAALAAVTSGDEFTAPTVVTNVVVNNNVDFAATRTVAGTMAINQDASIAAGKTVTATGNVTIATTKTLTATGTLTALANVTMNGTAAIAGASSLTFGGAADQTFAMGQATTVTNITIAQSADAKVNVTGGDLTVTGTLTLTRGLLVLPANKVILTGGFTRGGAYASHVVGTVQKAIPTATGRYEFPVGSLANYRPAAFTFTTAPIFAFNLMVNHVDASPEGDKDLPVPGTDIAAYPPFYWLISSNSNLGSAVSFNLELTAGGYTLPSGLLVTDLKIIRRVDGSAIDNPWSLQGGSYDNYLDHTVPTVANINSLGGINPAGARFTLGLKSTLVVLNTIPAQTLNVGTAYTNDLSVAPVFGGNAGALTYSATSSNNAVATVAVAGNILTVTPLQAGSAVITVKATDVNSAFKTTTFNVTVNPVVVNHKIAGTVKYDNTAATALKGVTVKLMNGATVVATATTDSTGAYSFTNLADGAYQLVATSTAAWTGVTANDASVVSNYYNGTQTLTPLRLAAADVNASNTVQNTDALQILLRYVGKITSFAKGDWTFSAPTATVNGADVTANITALCVGDVNGSAAFTSSLAKTVAMTNEGTINVNPGAAIAVPVKVNVENLGAISLKFKFDESMATFEGVSSKLEGVVYNVEGNVVSIAWANLSAKEAVNNGELTLNFKSTESFKAGSSFGIDLNAGEIATADGKVVANAMLKTSTVSAVVPSEFALRQNYPNPFNPTTTIQYDLPVVSKVNLVVYNMLGQVVTTLVDGVQEAGTQKVQFSAQNLTSGIYFYTLNVSNGDQKFTQTYKMILMK